METYNPENKAITGLISGFCYGGNAREIYLACCRGMGWDERKQKDFGFQALMYTDRADCNGHSVWFLYSNNLLGTKAKSFTNFILENGERIEELYRDTSINKYNHTSDCIVFAKNKKGNYEFLGVYKVAAIEGNKKVFQRIANSYSNH